MPDTLYTITDLAREFDITPRAIRFYENHRLLVPARSGANGMRRVYSARDRTRLKLTLRGKRLGFTLLEIARLLDLYDSPKGGIAQLQAFLDTIAAHRTMLTQQLSDLTAQLAELDACEADGRASLEKTMKKRAVEQTAMPNIRPNPQPNPQSKRRKIPTTA